MVSISPQIINLMEQDIFEKDKSFIINLILPLMGISDKDIDYVKENIHTESLSLLKSKDSNDNNQKEICVLENKKLITITFTNSEYSSQKLLVYFRQEIDDDGFNLFRYLYNCFHLFGGGSGDYLDNRLIKENIHELILQKGLISYIIGDESFKNNHIDNLLKSLQRWSEKTYEGHNVCYGFLINLNPKKDICVLGKSDSYGDFVDFIAEEYSAVFSDGITSVVEIDKDCNYIGYRSILHSISSLPDNLKNVYLPIRFAQIIYENVKNNSIGLFLLTNGDIILAKNQAIAFVKRGGRWLNFSQKAFYDIIGDYVANNSLKTLIQAVYCSCLDISFAHSGGLIAVVDDKGEKWINDTTKRDKPVVTNLDTLSEIEFDNIPSVLDNIYKAESQKYELDSNMDNTVRDGLLKDLNKRLTKKRYLLQILKNNTHFVDIDRKLRADLSGLDGAIILNTDGNVIACGAIIANEAGSSGGGRGSAARTLSKYGGFAIKISTDGYIEAFYNGARIYAIK